MSAPRLTFGGILRSEWIKLWSVRSTWWCLAITLVVMLGLSTLIGGVVPAPTDESGVAQPLGAPETLVYSTAGISFGHLVLGVLGCLVITGEFGTGMIRTSMLAAPRRIDAMIGKGLLFALVAFVVAVVAVVLSALLVVGLGTVRGHEFALDDGQLWRGLLGGAVYLALIAAFATGVGLIIRVSAGAIATVVGVLFVLPIVANLVAAITQATWVNDAAAFLPSNAGAELYGYDDAALSTGPGVALDWWQGGLVLLAWVVLVWVVGLLLVRRRDV